jgi:hypothetical protein
MMAKGHSLTGALLCGLAGPLIPSPMSPVTAVVVSAAAGAFLALLMDLDTKGKAYYVLRPLSWVLKPLLVGMARVIYHVTRGEKDPPNKGMHRMFTHQPEFALLLALLVLWATWGTPWMWWAAGITLVGVWAHRPGDACTKAGVPVSLTEVIRRRLRGERKAWVMMGAPRWLRFITGGKRGVQLFGAKSTRMWDVAGEATVTWVLLVACVGLGVATSAGWYPLPL